MTNRMKLIFVIATTVAAVLSMLTTPFAVDIAVSILGAVANILDLRETSNTYALAILIIPGLYFAFRQKRRT